VQAVPALMSGVSIAVKPMRSLPNAMLPGLACGVLGLALAPMAASQAMAQAVVQALPSSAQALPSSDPMNLNAALARLGRNPRDMQALIDAGQAALAIGDVDAAVGFFSRADQVSPGNPQVKLGLARALVLNGNPYDAFALFGEAERSGTLDAAAALDRGLAYDLVADNAQAQRYYRQALAAGPNEEASRRLAISLAISGDKRGSGTAISPLLARQDKAAWRARAFALAIMGQTEDAVAVVNGTLPAGLAAGIAPYLRYMPRLTPAQQAAAANFGQFPRASEIGQDDPRVARYATTSNARRVAVASADAGLIPKGEPLGRNARSRDSGRDTGRDSSRSKNTEAIRQLPSSVATADAFPPFVKGPAAAAPAAPQPVRPAVPATVAPVSAAAPVRAAAAAPVIAAAPARPAAVVVSTPVVQPTPRPTPPPPVTIAVAAAPPPPPPAVRVAPPTPAPPVPPTPRRMTLAEAFSDLSGPAADVTPAAGAVDIRRIRPTRVAATGATTPTPAAPSHPSRIWVQLATGRDRSALAYDWRRMALKAEGPFKNRRPSISSWGQTNRLLAGPFESEAAASSFMAQLRRASVDGAFQWTSPAGQVVDALASR
jgi:Flp pilus assembly protein TadD